MRRDRAPAASAREKGIRGNEKESRACSLGASTATKTRAEGARVVLGGATCAVSGGESIVRSFSRHRIAPVSWAGEGCVNGEERGCEWGRGGV